MRRTDIARPPRSAQRLLERILPYGQSLDVLGDLEEEYGERARERGRRLADLWYCAEVLAALPAFILRSINWSLIMLATYLKQTLRMLRRQKVFSAINIAGLALGMAAGFLILQYVAYEFSYDGFNENADRIYRITNDRYQNDRLIQHGVIFYPSVAKAMKAEYPEVADYTRLTGSSRSYVSNGDVAFDEPGMVFADSAFFSMFSFPLLEGDPATALAAPASIALSETTVRKYFGDDWRRRDVLGTRLLVDNRFEYTVSGVFRDIPANSHMHFDLVGSWSTFGGDAEDSWTNSNFQAYLLLAPGADPDALQAKFADFSQRHFNGTEVTGYREEFFLQPLKRIHLYSDYEYELWAHGNGNGVWTMLVIAGFILVIAWINYVNLSTARSAERAREVGIRKYAGAERRHLVKQFLVETTVLNVISVAAAVVLALLSAKFFNRFLGVQFDAHLWKSRYSLFFVATFVVGTALSGMYPALIFSSFNIIKVLRGKFSANGIGAAIRKGLVVFQYASSFALIAGTGVVYSQISYMMNEDLGMDIDHVVVVKGPRLARFDSTFYNSLFSLKDEMARYPDIRGTGLSPRLPGRTTGRIFNIRRVGDEEDRRFTTSEIAVGYEFLHTMGIDILAGRDLRASDHNVTYAAIRNVVINESAARLMGFADPASAVGQEISFYGKNWEIVGVAEDHHQESLKLPVEPIIFQPVFFTQGNLFVRVAPDNLDETMANVESVYRKFFPGNPFEYFFLEDVFNAQYEVDRLFGKLFSLFAGLGMLIACFGLFGLALYTTGQRTKEIGVRKAIGASTEGILRMLLKDFAILVAVAVIVSAPLTWLAMTNWLEGYAYHVNVTWLMLLVPGVAVLMIAMLTVGYQTVRAAVANPVKSLRYE